MKILILAAMLMISATVAAEASAQTTPDVKKATVALKGDAVAGAGKVTVCMACHGEKGQKPTAPIYPRLAGQSSEYLTSSLHAYRDGLRQGGMAAMMSPQTAALSDQDIVDIAAYYSQQ